MSLKKRSSLLGTMEQVTVELSSNGTVLALALLFYAEQWTQVERQELSLRWALMSVQHSDSSSLSLCWNTLAFAETPLNNDGSVGWGLLSIATAGLNELMGTIGVQPLDSPLPESVEESATS